MAWSQAPRPCRRRKRGRQNHPATASRRGSGRTPPGLETERRTPPATLADRFSICSPLEHNGNIWPAVNRSQAGPATTIGGAGANGRSLIYCNVSGELCRLDEKHVIPKAIGGNITLMEASCGDCSAITSAFEGHCCADFFESLRAERSLRGRRRKKYTHLPILEEFPPEINDPPAPRKLAKFETLVPTKDYPTTFVLP